MDGMDSERRQHLLRELAEQLQNMDCEQLQTVQHAVDALTASARGGLHYFGRFLGIDWSEDGEAFMRLGPHNANTYGVAQGGALFTLADIAIGYKILQEILSEEKVYTLELKMNYIKKGVGNKLTAKPNILHKGRKTVAADCRIEDEAGELVAYAVGTFYLTRVRKN